MVNRFPGRIARRHCGCAEKNCGERIDRPTRTFGTLRRFAAADAYLSDFRPGYHALRPLRFVLDCAVAPVVAYVKELTRNVACRIVSGESDSGRAGGAGEPSVDGALPNRSRIAMGRFKVLTPCGTHDPSGSLHAPYALARNVELGQQVLAAHAHFGMKIGDDGENCRVVDEHGQSAETERLLALIAGSLGGPVMQGDALRQRTFLRMRDSGATIAADTAGRLWYAAGHAPSPDALQTLTRLLALLSRDDRALSALLRVLITSP